MRVPVTSVITISTRPSTTEFPHVRLNDMARFGTAPALAPAPTLIAPLLSAAGFRYWYLVGLPDGLAIVPQPFWDGFFTSHSGTRLPPRMNFYAYYLMTFLKKTGAKRRQAMEADLRLVSDSSLRMPPNQVYQRSRLRSITLIAHRNSISTPDMILETIEGKRVKFGIQHHDFDQASAHLLRMYPGICKSS